MLNNKILEAMCDSTWALYKKTSWLKIITDNAHARFKLKNVLVETDLTDTIFCPFVSFGKQLITNLWIIREQ